MMTINMVLIFMVMVSLSCCSFWSLWLILEMFTFLVVPYFSVGESKSCKITSFLYFMIQSFSSVLFLFSSLYSEYAFIFISLSMFLKLGVFPFHFWIIKVTQEFSWEKLSIFLTLSKMIPLIVLMHYSCYSMLWLCIMGMLTPFGGYKTSCLRSIVGYSSIVNSSWLVVVSMTGLKFLSVYMMTYFLPLYFFCKSLYYLEKKSLKGMFWSEEKIFMMFLLLSMTGFPPFLGFFGKLVVIYSLIEFSVIEPMMMGVLSCIPLYFYMKMLVFLFINFSFSSSLKFSFLKSFNFILSMFIIMMILYSYLIS